MKESKRKIIHYLCDMAIKNWFKDWFNTKYYHTLYKHRDDQEASVFIKNLIDFLKIPAQSQVLDLACGKGRHSKTLHELGMEVTGVDLSEESIQAAKSHEQKCLQFEVHDMREPLKQRYDVIFNLFTSFGYFDTHDENDKVIKSIKNGLLPNGLLVIDFMNAHLAIKNLIPFETKIIDGIPFNLTKTYDGMHIFKDIEFEDQGQSFHFTERVQALKLADFEQLLTQNNMEILHIFGNFQLEEFDENTSERLIIVAKN